MSSIPARSDSLNPALFALIAALFIFFWASGLMPGRLP
jgi:hypothetical protein